jgi:peptidyl-Asp metalloendopeptidase
MKVNKSAFLAGLLMIVPHPAGASDVVAMDDAADGDVLPGEVATGSDLPPVGEDGAARRVDILVAYTPAARAYAGSTNAMKAAINGYIAATNDSFENSDIQVVLKLVGAVEVAYAESSSFSTDLSRLQSTSDSHLTTVPSLRNTYQADFVSLIRRNSAGGIAGLAYIGNGNSNFSPYAYSVVADVWALGNLSFPHELGHNFGCQHNRENANTTPVRAYAYGHKFTGSNNTLYCSVMSYQPGTRVPYFSNPSITYMGAATGVDGGATPADNARMIEEMAVPTAGFRNGGSRLGSALVGDLNNDGDADIILTDQISGERFVWQMVGGTPSALHWISTNPLEWRIACAADFDGDGKTDLVWQNLTTGARAMWFMDSTTRLSASTFATSAVAWRIVAAADFDADGKNDLVWENVSTGQRAVWFMDGTTRKSAITFATSAVSWRIAVAGDFNGDGKPDLVWENTVTGARAMWFMDGTTRTSATTFATSAVAWRIVGATDFDGDGKLDLAFENSVTKARVVWFMDGAVRLSTGVFPAVTDA